MLDKLTHNRFFLLMLGVIIIILILVLTNITGYIKSLKLQKENKLNLIKGLSPEDTAKLIHLEKKKKKETKTLKKYPFKKTIEEYVFFGGNLKKLLQIVIIGFLSTFFLYYLVSKELLYSAIFSVYFFLITYLLVTSGVKKKRLNYLKSFANSLEILSSSIEAGNSLESAINNIQKRSGLNPRILKEFAILSNNIKSNMSLEESLNHFWERNNVYEEFSMFVIVLQFFMKSGGRNLDKMFNSMKVSVQQKVENYSLIESKIGSYNVMFKLFIYLNVGFSLIGGFFIQNFYASLSNGTGILRAVGSVSITFLSCYLFNMFIRSSAEA